VYTSTAVIVSFADQATEDVYHGVSSKAARKLPKELWERIRDKLDLLNASQTIDDLRAPPANRLEKLRGKWQGFYSIRANEQYRIVFRFEAGHCSAVQCIDYH
jgi:proteic killer suppression protein